MKSQVMFLATAKLHPAGKTLICREVFAANFVDGMRLSYGDQDPQKSASETMEGYGWIQFMEEKEVLIDDLQAEGIKPTSEFFVKVWLECVATWDTVKEVESLEIRLVGVEKCTTEPLV